MIVEELPDLHSPTFPIFAPLLRQMMGFCSEEQHVNERITEREWEVN